MVKRKEKTSMLVFVDVEAAEGPTPFSGKMTEFGAVEFGTRESFHGRVYKTITHPAHAAKFVITGDAEPLASVIRRFSQWLDRFDARPVFVSDNPAFDWQWIAHGFDVAGIDNPFGFSARRIGDLYAGFSGNWKSTNVWKRLRRTVHDHNPVNDAMGNAEAYEEILRRFNQELPHTPDFQTSEE
ncbi:MAG: 3'-5' exoribonuclease [Actinomycetaceae bacterium]|nr:3'-5' exoribonuclease [Actinomycetaceae bacterium]